MEYRPLEITLISAKDLKDVNLLSRIDVYAVVTINGDPQTKQKTHVDKDCGSNPKWNHTMKFTVDEAAANQNLLNFSIRLVSDRRLGDQDIGEVVVPIKELMDSKEKVLSYDVRMPNGKVKGTLNLSCKTGEKFSVPVAAPPYVAEKGKVGETPVMAYPAVGCSSGCPPPPAAYPYHYPPPGVYPPPPQPYGYAPPPPAPGYGYPGYPPPPAEYPYHYPPPGVYPPPPQPYGYAPPPPAVGYGYPRYSPHGGYGKPGAGAGLGLGLAGGLLGGLILGEMASDALDGGLDF